MFISPSSTATTFYKTNNKLINTEALLSKQNRQMDKLKNELIKVYQDKEDLKIYKKNCYNLEEQLKIIEDEMKKTNKEKLELIKKRDEKFSLLNRKINELENIIDFEKLDYEKNTVLYKQKMSVYNHLLMENEVYSEEVDNLKKQLENFDQKKKEELQKEKVVNLLKYEKLKKKMLETIKQSNEESSKLNLEYMDVNNKLSILQNKQLMLHIEYQKEKIKDLEQLNKDLMKRLNEYEKDIEIHKLIEKDLIQKNKGQNSENTIKNPLYFKKKRKISINAKHSVKKINNISNNNINNINIINKKINKSNSTMNVNFISRPSLIEKRLLSYEKEIKEKKFENENILLANSRLKNKLNLYYNKFKGLFFFLEECLNNFFKDKEIKENKHFFLKIEDIKKMKFDDFNNEEKYAILVLLMKHLLPLVTVNFNNKDNIGKELFKTNLNIIDKNFSINKNYLQDKTLKNAFMDNNNKYHNDLHFYKTSYINQSIPVLRKLQDIELDFYDMKNKAIFY